MIFPRHSGVQLFLTFPALYCCYLCPRLSCLLLATFSPVAESATDDLICFSSFWAKNETMSPSLPLAERRSLWDSRWKKPGSRHLANMGGFSQVRNAHLLRWEMNTYCLSHQDLVVYQFQELVLAELRWLSSDTPATSPDPCISRQSPLLPRTTYRIPKVSKGSQSTEVRKSFLRTWRECVSLLPLQNVNSHVLWNDRLQATFRIRAFCSKDTVGTKTPHHRSS